MSEMKKGIKKIASLILTLLMVFSVFPASVFAAERNMAKDQVRVIVENTTFMSAEDSEDGSEEPAWSGTLVDTWVDIDKDSTMMSCLVAALEEVGATQEGAENNYVSSIEGLSAFDGSSMSGWMGTLNDWFTNEGFGAFTVASGSLAAGDEIRIMFTMSFGEDIGGSWGNSDTTVKAVSVKAYDGDYKALGEITWDKAFAKDANEYGLTLPEGTAFITVEPTASNKNYQVRTYLGTADVSKEGYKRTAFIPVADKDEINVVCADPSWPSMNTSDAAQSYKLVLAIPMPEPTKDVTINVSPTTVDAEFFSGANADAALGDAAVKDNGQVKVGYYTYHQYVISVPEGVYSYRGTEAGVALGGESFTVDASSDTLNLLRANIRYNGTSLNNDGDYTFTLKNGASDVVCGTPYVTNSIRYTPTLLIAGVKHTGNVELAEKNTEDFYLNPADGSFSTTPSKTATSAANVNLPIQAYKKITLTAPADASVTFFAQEKNFLVKTLSADTVAANGDGTVSYMFKSTAAHSNYEYRVSRAGEVTQAGYLKDGDNISVTFKLGRSPKSTSSTMDYDDNSVLLNINEKNKLSLSVGDTFKLRAYRAAWQIINTTTGNIMIEPEFNYAILAGENIVSLEPASDSSKGEPYSSGNAKNNWVKLTALKEGTAIVAVYYDAVDIYGANPANANGISTFGATNPARYGVFVVNVGKDAQVTWNPVSEDGDWDAEFDTIYYSGANGIFGFKPSEAVKSVSVRNVYGTTLGNEQIVSASEDGTYEVPVTTGANIVAVTTASGTDYQVVRAKKINYTITNNTTGDSKVNGAPDIKTGDSVTISFDKLDMPIPKFSGIYNPGYLGTAKTAYTINGSTLITSAGTQYDFSTKNSITFTAHFVGTNTLKGYLNISSMGSDFGAHRSVDDNGVPANLNASEKYGKFGALPDITFEVEDSGESASYEDTVKITSLTVKGANSTGYLTGFANWTKLSNGSSNWTADAATVANYNISALVKTQDYNNSLQLLCWYDGEEVTTTKLVSGVTTVVPNFKLDPSKILNIQVVCAPLDETLGAPVVYTYVVFPGKTNQQYVHPIISALKATSGGVEYPITDKNGTAFNTASTEYAVTLGKDRVEKLTLDGTMLVQIYNASTAADMSDEVVLTKYMNGKPVGDAVKILEKGVPTNPNRNWTLADLDITDADAFEITVSSYCNENAVRTYHFDIERCKHVWDEGEADGVDMVYTCTECGEKKVVRKYQLVLNSTLEQLAKTVSEPTFGTGGGEWSVLALARGEYYDTDDEYFNGYYSRIEAAVKEKAEKVNLDGALDKNKSTENSRLIIALSSIGKNATEVNGFDLVEAYSKNGFKWITKQGINGPIFALIAWDTIGYEPSDDTLRQQCIDYILGKELEGGGWALSGTNADPDITSMALQALAAYKDNEDVAAAAERAFAKLSSIQLEDGGFSSWGSENSESIAQVVTALSAWGIDADSDERFIKNGKSAIDGLLKYYVEDGKGFAHVLSSGGGYVGGAVNGMATDQAAYALVAYDRFMQSKTSLYDMTDVITWKEIVDKKAAEEEAARQAEEEAARKAAEEAEAKRKAEEEAARKAAEEAEAKRKAEEEAAKKAAEEAEAKRKAEEEAARKAAEEAEAKRKAEEEAARKAAEEAEAKRKAEEEAARQAEQAKTEEEKRLAEEALTRAAEERKAAEEAARQAEEAAKKAAEDAEAKKKAEEEAARNKKYVVISGADQEVELGEDVSFRSDAEFSKFKAVLVDDKEIDAENYTVKEGSTIVTLKGSFIKTLSVGGHSLTIASKDGKATTGFTVIKPADKDADPAEGDMTFHSLWIICIIAAAFVGLISVLVIKKVKKNK